MTIDLTKKNILITGGSGFLGRTFAKTLEYDAGVPAERIRVPRSADCDLRDLGACEKIFSGAEVIFHCAGRVPSRIEQQRIPGEVFYDNVLMNINVLEAARKQGAEKVVLVSSALAYPATIEAPFKESVLWDGYPPANAAPYALSKRIMSVQARAYHLQYGMNVICLLLPNFYGPDDKFSADPPPLVASLVGKLVEAKRANTPFLEEYAGEDRIELIYIEDAARGIIRAAKEYHGAEPLNLGAGALPPTIREIATMLKDAVGYVGEIHWQDPGRPAAIRYLDAARQKEVFDWAPSIPLAEGLKTTVEWFLAAA